MALYYENLVLMAFVPIHTEFKAQLRRAGLTQSTFARRFGYTVKAVNNWCNGRRRVPRSAWALARAVERISEPDFYNEPPKAPFSWQETLGCHSLPGAREARDKLAKQYHPDYGGSTAAMQRINAAYERAMRA